MPAHPFALGEIEVFFLDLAKAASILEAEESGSPRLSASDNARAAATRDPEARRLWRASRIATRIVLERACGPSIRQADFAIEPGGRPRLAAGLPWFNISHTGEAALIAASKSVPVGVDLERRHRSLKMPAERRQRVIAAAGRLGPEHVLSADRDSDVMVAWVCLEAAAKALGIGIGRLLTEQGVVGGNAAGSSYNLQVRTLDLGDDYVAAVAAERLPEKIGVLPFPADNLDGFIPTRS
ncbi:phosphopantetheinyl transferase [Hyphomicrobium sp.]|uniref:4'-phosphopantetheinyl transferase family protein n=1 Tax=Hyphomicrobium sp. TaxID=82 RepID=UPI002D7986B7|nr:phosphopantetheinyl transferase [Hyphomicrobium sp.]HET6389099.1 phosphopantetheinyl transferase [Hyphomicrobium sp.]